MERLKHDHMGARCPDLVYSKPFSEEIMEKIRKMMPDVISPTAEEKAKNKCSVESPTKTPTQQ